MGAFGTEYGERTVRNEPAALFLDASGCYDRLVLRGSGHLYSGKTSDQADPPADGLYQPGKPGAQGIQTV